MNEGPPDRKGLKTMATNQFGMMLTPSAESIERLLRGAIDLHVHIAPDPSTCRGYDAIAAAREAAALGMRGYVAKSFFAPTTADAQLARSIVPEVFTAGSVTIGFATTGGLDYAPETVETHAKMGCRVLWFPAFDAANCRRALGQEGGIRILDEQGRLKPEVPRILQIAKTYDMAVCSGHMAFDETIAMFRAAKENGITKLVATHPLVEIWPAFCEEELGACVDQGALLELTYGMVMPRNGSFDPRRFVNCVRMFGADHCLMSTDGSQITDPSPALCMRLHIAMMLQFGCSEEEVWKMCQRNPARLLGLDG